MGLSHGAGYAHPPPQNTCFLTDVLLGPCREPVLLAQQVPTLERGTLESPAPHLPGAHVQPWILWDQIGTDCLSQDGMGTPHNK